MNDNGARPDLVAELLGLPGPRRVDRLRRALRGGEKDAVDATSVLERIDGWVALFHRDAQPALRVLVLEVLDGTGDPRLDPRVDALLHEALHDRGDSVRLEALRQLLQRGPSGAREIALGFLGDEAMEVRVFAAQAVYESDRELALDALFGAVLAEARGPREMHTLRWVLEFLVEEAVDRSTIDRIAELRAYCDDVEESIEWAIDRLRSAPGAPDAGEDPA